jgi:hypothetical protein
VLEDSGYAPEPYSGRGMYGEECVSLQDDDLSVWEIARCLWLNNFDRDDLDIPEPKQDSLGLGIVLYWPSYVWPEE